MNLLRPTTESPRLLSTAALEAAESDAAQIGRSKARLAREGLFTGNGRAIFIGLLAGAVGISAIGYFYQSKNAQAEFEAMRKFVAVRTKAVKAPAPSATPRVVVRIPSEALRVTAIALGHPRLAVINGKEVTEGDSLSVQAGGVQITLHVLKIADRSIELTDGTQIITTRMLSEARPASTNR